MDRHAGAKRYGLFDGRGLEDRLNAFRGSRRMVGQKAFGQVERAFQPNASRAEIPFGSGKNPPRGGVVKVDTVGIRKHEFDPSKRLVRAWILSEAVGEVVL